MWAFKRRLNIILLIFATILCFVVIPYYLMHREVPTCFDGKRNQNEEGVDCGGGCALVCKGKAQELKVLWSKVDEVRTGVFEAAFMVENPNFNVGAPNVPYSISLYDKNRGIGERTGVTYAGSNETFLVYEGNIHIGEGRLDSAKIIFGDFPWVATQRRQELFSIVEKKLEKVDTIPKLSALVRNDTTVPQEGVEVVATISDDSGSVVGYGKTFVDRLLPKESKPVTFSWTKPFSYQASLESCDVPVDVMLVFDRSGSMKSDGKEPPEPLTTAKNAVIGFLDKFRPEDQVGVVSFASAPSNPIDRMLTTDRARVRTALENITIGAEGTQYTNIGDSLKEAQRELESRRDNPDAANVIILLTDGDPTYPEHPLDKNYPLFYASEVAKSIVDKGTALYAIGLGGEVRGEYLESLTGDPSRYFFAQNANNLSETYINVSSTLCKKAPSVIEVLPRVNNVSR